MADLRVLSPDEIATHLRLHPAWTVEGDCAGSAIVSNTLTTE